MWTFQCSKYSCTLRFLIFFKQPVYSLFYRDPRDQGAFPCWGILKPTYTVLNFLCFRARWMQNRCVQRKSLWPDLLIMRPSQAIPLSSGQLTKMDCSTFRSSQSQSWTSMMHQRWVTRRCPINFINPTPVHRRDLTGWSSAHVVFIFIQHHNSLQVHIPWDYCKLTKSKLASNNLTRFQHDCFFESFLQQLSFSRFAALGDTEQQAHGFGRAYSTLAQTFIFKTLAGARQQL